LEAGLDASAGACSWLCGGVNLPNTNNENNKTDPAATTIHCCFLSIQ